MWKKLIPIFLLFSLLSALSASSSCYTSYTLPTSQYSFPIVSYFISNDSDLLFICYQDSNVKIFNLQTNFLVSQIYLSSTFQKVLSFHKLSTQDVFLIIYDDLNAEIRSFRASWILENGFRVPEIPSLVFSSENNEFFYLVKGRRLYKYNFFGVLLNTLQIEKIKEIYHLDGSHNSDNILILSEKDFLLIYNMRNDSLEEAKIDIKRKITSFSIWNEEIIILGTLEGEIILWNLEKKVIIQKMHISNFPIKYINDYKNFVSIITANDFFFGIIEKNSIKIERKMENSMAMIRLYLDSKKNVLQILTSNYNSGIMIIRIQFMHNLKCLNTCPKGTYVNPEQNLNCMNCSKNCSSCLDNSNCVKCIVPFVLENGICLKACSFFRYFDENTSSCQSRMVSWSFLFSAFGLFLGMELVRKFWKQISKKIKKGVKEICSRRKRGTSNEEAMQNHQKITDLEKRTKLLTEELDFYKQKSNQSDFPSSDLTIKNSNSIFLDLSPKEYATLLPYENIKYLKSKENIIGKGGFSVVYSSYLYGSSVAIKKFSLPLSSMNSEELRSILSEITIMNSLSHENILALKYFAFRPKSNKISFKLVTELMPSDLSKRIQSFPPLDNAIKMMLALEIIKGLKYLHGKGIQHLDLKPQNILLTEQMKVKIGDFGISKQISSVFTQRTNPTGVSFRYCAREYLIENRVSPQKTDIWSFGVILYEMFTLKKAWQNMEISEIRIKMENRENFWICNKLNTIDKKIKKVMKRCLVHETDKRAGADEIGDMMIKIVQEGNKDDEKTRRE